MMTMKRMKRISAEQGFDKIIVFGSGEWGRYTLTVLQNSDFKDKDIVICDNNKNKWNTVGGGG